MDGGHHILTIHQEIIQDPVLIEVCKRLFDFANRMGLDGFRLTNLQFIQGNDPLDKLIYVICEKKEKESEGERAVDG